MKEAAFHDTPFFTVIGKCHFDATFSASTFDQSIVYFSTCVASEIVKRKNDLEALWVSNGTSISSIQLETDQR